MSTRVGEKLLHLILRCYRRMLRLYPGLFRELFEPEMSATQAARCLAVRSERGLTPALGLALNGCLDTLLHAPVLFLKEVRQQRRRIPSVCAGRDTDAVTVDFSPGGRLTGLGTEVRIAVRTLGRRPGFAATAIATFALGLGLTSALFILNRALFHRDLGVPEQSALVRVFTSSRSSEYLTASYPDFLDYREATREILVDLAACAAIRIPMGDAAGQEMVLAEEVSRNYFAVMGCDAVLGRTFPAEVETAPGGELTVVISHGLWRRSFGSDPAVIGRPMRLNGYDFTIIGVAAQDFGGLYPYRVDLWVPLAGHHLLTGCDPAAVSFFGSRAERQFLLVGRLRAGASIDQLRASLEVVSDRLAAAYPGTNDQRRGTALPADEVVFIPLIDSRLKMISALLTVLAGIVLLVAGTNLTGLHLVRAAHRRTELGVRRALGASGRRLVCQLLIESTLLAMVGGIIGLLTARWLLDGLLTLLPFDQFVLDLDFGLDPAVLGFTLLLTAGAGIAVGIAPALQSARSDITTFLRPAVGRTGTRRVRSRGSRLLLTGQVAASVLLLICAGLFLRSLTAAVQADPGFRLDRGVIVELDPGASGYAPGEGGRFFAELQLRLAALPGVTGVTTASDLPLDGTVTATRIFPVGPGSALDEEGDFQSDLAAVGSDYFEVMGIDLLAGRAFEASDGTPGQQAAVVNRAFAQRCWPDEPALGQRFRWGETGPEYTVVGVTADGRYRSLGEAPRPFFYYPFAPDNPVGRLVIVRTQDEGRTMLPLIRRTIGELDPHLPVLQEMTIADLQAVRLLPSRLGSILLTGLGSLALLLGTIGLWGVIGLEAARRIPEAGLRLALGARPRQVRHLILRDGFLAVGIGLLLGIVGAGAASHALSSVVYGVRAFDVPVFLAAPLLFLLVTGLAVSGPLRRIARVDPVEALRYE